MRSGGGVQEVFAQEQGLEEAVLVPERQGVGNEEQARQEEMCVFCIDRSIGMVFDGVGDPHGFFGDSQVDDTRVKEAGGVLGENGTGGANGWVGDGHRDIPSGWVMVGLPHHLWCIMKA